MDYTPEFARLDLELSFTVETEAGSYRVKADDFEFEGTEGGPHSLYLLNATVAISGPGIDDTVTVPWYEYVNDDGSIEEIDDAMSHGGYEAWRYAMPDVSDYDAIHDDHNFCKIDEGLRRHLRCYDLLDLAMHSRREYRQYVAERERLEARIRSWDKKLACDLVERLNELREHIEDEDNAEFREFAEDKFDPMDWASPFEIEAAIVPGVTVIDIDETNRAVIVEADGGVDWVVPTWWSLAHHLEYVHRDEEAVEMDHGSSTLRVDLDDHRWVGLGLKGSIELVEGDTQIVADDYASEDLEDYQRALINDPVGFATRIWVDFAPDEDEDEEEDDLAA